MWLNPLHVSADTGRSDLAVMFGPNLTCPERPLSSSQ